MVGPQLSLVQELNSLGDEVLGSECMPSTNGGICEGFQVSGVAVREDMSIIEE